MRIGIDARSLIFTKAGINRYTRNIIGSLAEIGPDNEYALFCNAKIPQDRPGHDNIRQKIVRFPNLGNFTERIWEEFLLPRGLSSEKIDLFHSPRFIFAQRKACKLVVTIPDMAFIKFPGLIAKKYFKHLKNQLESGIKNADRIIALSHNTREDLVRFGAGEEKVDVVYAGIDGHYRPHEDRYLPRHLKDRYNLPEKFILFVGTIEPRKNLKRLVEAFCRLKEKRPTEHGMVIVGDKGALYRELSAYSKKLRPGRDVVFTGYVPESELPFIYNAADLFVYPSLYEGFGFPPLEAMACGVPVIASDVSSIPEVTGQAALLIDPYDVETIAGGMERLLEDGDLRKKMIDAGFRQVKKFSWEEAARRTLEVYRRCK